MASTCSNNPSEVRLACSHCQEGKEDLKPEADGSKSGSSKQVPLVEEREAVIQELASRPRLGTCRTLAA